MIAIKEIRRAAKFWNAALDKGYAAQAKPNNITAQTIVLQKFKLDPNDRKTVHRMLNVAQALGMDVPGWASHFSQAQEAKIRLEYGVPEVRPAASPVVDKPGRSSSVVGADMAGQAPSLSQIVAEAAAKVGPMLKRKPLTLAEVAAKMSLGEDVAYAAISTAQAAGATVVKRGEFWHLDDAPVMGSMQPTQFQFTTDKDGYFEFAACSDEHLGNKNERLDCLNDYYDQIERRGITTVFNQGNWIDGEAPFNKHEIHTHGMDNQVRYLVDNYPQRKGVNIYAIAGEDHEGWYSRREGIDIGKHAERMMREAGRTDWNNLGFMECFVPIAHRESGKSSQICVVHPGGGSSYAVSYTSQKLVESFDGGSKPAVLLIGHYHKAVYLMARNVHTLQTGTFCDQTIFMRKKRLAAHVGGWFVKIHVDPRTGAVDEFTCTFRNYFDRGYANGQWSQSGPVVKTPKSWKAVG